MADPYEEFRQFVLSADSRSLVEQLSKDVKEPLGSAHSLIHMLTIMQNPSPAIQQKIDRGELDAGAILEQLSELVGQVFDCLDTYRQVLNEE